MRKFFAILLLFGLAVPALRAQATFEADTTLLVEAPAKKAMINDYVMIGVNYGVTFSNMMYTPSRHNRAWQFSPNYVSVTFTKFSKMFDRLPLDRKSVV